jgi:hypothetical protein
MRFLVDDYGFGAEVEGLSGREVVYLARKPKDGFALHRDHDRQRLERACDHVGVIAADLSRRQLEDSRMPLDCLGEQRFDVALDSAHGPDALSEGDQQ